MIESFKLSKDFQIQYADANQKIKISREGFGTYHVHDELGMELVRLIKEEKGGEDR